MHINASNMLELQGPVIAKNLTIALSYKQHYKCVGMKSQFVYRELFFSPCFADISECTIAWLSWTSFRQQRSPNCLYFLIITGWLETTVSLSLDACWWLPSDSCYICDITGCLVTVNSCQVMTSLVA